MDNTQNDNAQDQGGQNITQAETNDGPVTGESTTDAGAETPAEIPPSE